MYNMYNMYMYNMYNMYISVPDHLYTPFEMKENDFY